MSFREIGLVTQGKPYEDWLRSLARSVSLMKCVTWRWRSSKGWKRLQEAEPEPNFIHVAIPQLEIIHQDVQQVAWGHGCSFAQDSRYFSGCWFGGCFASGWTHTGHSLDGRVSGNHHVRHHHFQETFRAGEGPQAFRFVGRCRKSFDWMLSFENSEHCIIITRGWQRLAKDMPRPLQSKRHLFWGNVSRTVALASCSYQKDRSESLKKSFTKVAWHLIGVWNFHEFSVGMFANISPRSYSYLMNIVQTF